ncbi:phosphatase PAP2 family protein [Aeromicrobium phragmitis]|uniref:Phosphatase PAP2 family protein n=1 Tax=Aeromicrobium phragmitis TaxID=2478914 RepID=A0A3L8PRM3_9ACTN|nr:phosphatase PAP2 family protein [Aeromicrobium phragmitis]RLV57293.1 phosphatase PAP2 family protein [Aeromicrobium phragmitis]
MSVDTPVQPTRSAARRGRVNGVAAIVAVLAILGLGALVATALASSTGQLVDDAAMNAVTANNTTELTLLSGLGRVSLGAILAVAVGCVAIAVVRRRFALAVGAVAIIGASNVTTQLLKDVLDRPNLGLGVHNSLPSGHTTVVVSAVAALLLVLPAVIRPLMAVIGSAAIGLTGLSTIVAGWHRPADVLAALLVVLAWTGAVSVAVGGRRGPVVLSGLASFIGAISSVVILVALGVRPEHSWQDLLLATAVLGVVAVVTSVAVTLLTLITPARD